MSDSIGPSPESDQRLDALFRSCVTAHIADILSADILEGESMSDLEQMHFMGLGVAMTANIIGLLALEWEVPSEEAWERICRLGRDLGLPGMT